MTSLYCVTMGWQSFTEFLDGTTFWLLLGKNQRRTKQTHSQIDTIPESVQPFTCILFWFCRFHVEICVFLLSLVVLPTRGICFMLVNWFFLANEVVFHSEYLTYYMLTWLIPWLIFQCEKEIHSKWLLWLFYRIFKVWRKVLGSFLISNTFER